MAYANGSFGLCAAYLNWTGLGLAGLGFWTGLCFCARIWWASGLGWVVFLGRNSTLGFWDVLHLVYELAGTLEFATFGSAGLVDWAGML